MLSDNFNTLVSIGPAWYSFLQVKRLTMNRTLGILFIIIALATFNKVHAQDYRLGLGIRLSNASPTLSNSFTAKYFVTDRSAVEGLVSFGTRFGVGGLIELYKPFASAPGLSWFYGGGAYVGFQDHDTYLGPTGIIGLDYKFNNIPLNLSVDWKPELDILPAINFIPDAFAVSVRFTLR